jgi:hypothetical protein
MRYARPRRWRSLTGTISNIMSRRSRSFYGRCDKIETQMIGVRRLTYPLDAMQGKYVSVFMDPSNSFQTYIAFQKHGFRNAILTIDEWQHFISAGDEFEKHLYNIEDMSEKYSTLEIGTRYILRFIKRWNRPGILLSLRSDIPTYDNLCASPSVYINASTWKILKNSVDMIQHAISRRIEWHGFAQEVYTSVFSNFNEALKENCIDVGDNGRNLNKDLLKKTIDIYLASSFRDVDFKEFDLVAFLHEMVVFYENLF